MRAIEEANSTGLGKQPISGLLYREREKIESPLPAANRKVQAECDKAHAEQAKLEEGPDPADVPVPEVEDLFAMLMVLLPGQVKELLFATQALEAYRLRHCLTRLPNIPDILQALLSFALMILAEAVGNATFFVNAHMVAGPEAALVVSMLISAVNVILSACAGFFIGRWLDYGVNAVDADDSAFTIRRHLAKSLMLVYVGVVSFLHLTVGLIRTQESLDRVEHGLDHYIDMVTTPEALFLVLIGICLSALAFRKGKHLTDPYPGYWRQYRAVRERQDALQDGYEACAQQINERFDEAEDAMDQALKKQKRNYATYNKSVRRCLKARRELEQETRCAENILRTRVAQLAGHHRIVRGQPAPEPASLPMQLVSFENYLDIEIPAFANPPDAGDGKARLAEARADALRRLKAMFEPFLSTQTGELSIQTGESS